MEYGLILSLAVVIAVVALVFFGPQLAWALSLIGTQIDKAGLRPVPVRPGRGSPAPCSS